MKEAVFLSEGCERESLPWDPRQKALDFLKPDTRLLLLFPKKESVFLSLGHDPERCTAVLEPGAAPFPLPRGTAVIHCRPDETYPFPENSFDLILCDGSPYLLSEVFRVLKSGGFFLTCQFGGEDCLHLRRIFSWELSGSVPSFNLENQLPAFLHTGFRVMYRDQAYPTVRFTTLEALRSFLSGQPRRFPQFSGVIPESLKTELQKTGSIVNEEHRFCIIGKKK